MDFQIEFNNVSDNVVQFIKHIEENLQIEIESTIEIEGITAGVHFDTEKAQYEIPLENVKTRGPKVERAKEGVRISIDNFDPSISDNPIQNLADSFYDDYLYYSSDTQEGYLVYIFEQVN